MKRLVKQNKTKKQTSRPSSRSNSYGYGLWYPWGYYNNNPVYDNTNNNTNDNQDGQQDNNQDNMVNDGYSPDVDVDFGEGGIDCDYDGGDCSDN